MLGGIAVLFVCILLMALLRGRSTFRSDAAYHLSLDRSIELTSSAFAHQGPMPVTYSCEGTAGPPPLAWANVPEGARSFVLIATDGDIPSPNLHLVEFVHWVLYDIPPEVRALDAQIGVEGLAQMNAVMGRNGYGQRLYVAPCPVSGLHRYVYRPYALDVATLKPRQDTKAGVRRAIKGHVLGFGELVGTYQLAGTSGWAALRRIVRR